MKPNPLLVIGVIFALSFSGRTISIASAALNKSEKQTAQSEHTSLDEKADTLIEHHKSQSEAAKKYVAMKNDQKSMQSDHDDEIKKQIHDLKNSEVPHKNTKAYNDLLEAVRDRATDLNRRSRYVEDRIRVLEIVEKRVEERLAEFQIAHDELEKLVSFADEAAKKDIELLSKMYEQMKPKKAGEIFDKMNPEFAAGFLTEMNSEAAALILTNMATDQAYQTSMIIASRNAAVHQ